MAWRLKDSSNGTITGPFDTCGQAVAAFGRQCEHDRKHYQRSSVELLQKQDIDLDGDAYCLAWVTVERLEP